MAENASLNNQSIDKALDIIEVMAKNGTPMRLNDIAVESGLSKSTAFRMINAMRNRGYILQNKDTTRYMLSPKFSLIGHMVEAQFDLRDLVHPYMVNLAGTTNRVSYLAVERQSELVYVDMVSPPGSIMTRMPFVGKTAPLHQGNIGLTILSDYPESKLREYLRQYTQDHPEENAEQLIGDLFAQVNAVRSQGYSCNPVSYWEAGNSSVAVPLRNHAGKVIAGLSLGAPGEQLTEAQISEILPLLIDAAAEISKKLAYRAF